MPDHVARIIVHPPPLPFHAWPTCVPTKCAMRHRDCVETYSIVGEKSDYHKMKLPARNRMISAYLNVAEFLSIKMVDTSLIVYWL